MNNLEKEILIKRADEYAKKYAEAHTPDMHPIVYQESYERNYRKALHTYIQSIEQDEIKNTEYIKKESEQ